MSSTSDPFVDAFLTLILVAGPALVLGLVVLIGEPILMALEKRRAGR
jgi:hypothetical protein